MVSFDLCRWLILELIYIRDCILSYVLSRHNLFVVIRNTGDDVATSAVLDDLVMTKWRPTNELYFAFGHGTE